MHKVASKMGRDGAKMAVLGSTCEVLARSWLDFGRFCEALGSILEAFCGIGGSVKPNNTMAFWQYFGYLGWSWQLCCKMLFEVGAKMGPKSRFFVQVGILGGYLGANFKQHLTT